MPCRRVLGIEILEDPRFCDRRDRIAHQHELALLISNAVVNRQCEELSASLLEAGVAAVVPAADQKEIFKQRVNWDLGRIAEVMEPEQGKVREVAVLIRVTDAPSPAHRIAPDLGQHTEAFLAELGYAQESIDGLRSESAIR